MRYAIPVTAAVILATFSVHAFGERWQTTPQPVPTPADAQPMTVLGCVRTWDPTTLTAGSRDPAGGPTQYVLTGVETPPTDTPPTPAVPEPPTPGVSAPTAAGAHSTYLLSSMPTGPDLAGYIDQQVEVSGALVADGTVPPTRGTPPPAAAPAPPTSRPTPPPTPPAAFKVATIKVVAKSCS